MRRAGYLLAAPFAVCALALSALLLSGSSVAVQDPRMSLDMDPAGNSYDPATNTMTVGAIDSCLASPEANANTHTHAAQVVIENVEDLVGWQARLNYDGDRMWPQSVDFSPFTDTTTGQEISFVNLPKEADTGRHRDLVPAADIPPGAPGLQSALVGATYLAERTADISPDTPAKNPPDDTSYGAPSGGVLAAIDLQVVGDQRDNTLFMQVDDANPNHPGSTIVFSANEAYEETVDLPETSLGSGFHAEGAQVCSAVPTPTNAPATPSPSPTPGSERLADIALSITDGSAPASAQAGEGFDVLVGAEIRNLGPDTTQLVASSSFYVANSHNCFRMDTNANVVELGSIEANGYRRYVTGATFACAGESSGFMPVTIEITLYASGGADDPNLENNASYGQVIVNILGTSSLPTPTPDGDSSVPIAAPTEPTPSPSSETVAGGAVQTSSEESGTTAPGSSVLAVGSSTTPTRQALAAALPSTGRSGDGASPGWTYLLPSVAMATGLACLAAIARRRFRRRRR